MKTVGRICLSAIVIAAPSMVVASQTIADLTAESRATVSGIVHDITDEDSFILKDHTGTIPVYIGPNTMPVREGMSVTVHGTVDDDLTRELYATRIAKPDGTTTELTYDYD